MIDIVIAIKSSYEYLNKILLSFILQERYELINVIIVDSLNDKSLSTITEKFLDKLNINVAKPKKNENLFQCGLNKSTAKYIMFLEEDEYFYDGFSLDYILYSLENSNYSFAYGKGVCCNSLGLFEEFSIKYSLKSKVFVTELLKNNNFVFSDSDNFDISFLFKVFILAADSIFVDANITCIDNYSNSINIENYVSGAINAVDFCSNLVDKIVIKNFLYELITFLYNSFIFNNSRDNVIANIENMKLLEEIYLKY